jgi:hypothetical protein
VGAFWVAALFADGLYGVFSLDQVSERGIAIINRERDNIHS